VTRCDAAPAAAVQPSAGRLPRAVDRRPDTAKQLRHGVLGRDGIDRQTGSELQTGDLAQPGMDLPVPVIRGVDLLTQRGRMEYEVVGRSIEAGGEPSEHLAEGF
jgi:hypothetical protein